MKIRKLFSPWAVQGLLLLLILSGTLLDVPFLRVADYPLYDRLCRQKQADLAGKVAVVAIDPLSIAALGDWPWPRTYLADMVERIRAAEAKATGLFLPLSHRQATPQIDAIRSLAEGLLETPGLLSAQGRTYVEDSLAASLQNLDGDKALARAVTKGTVVLPVRLGAFDADAKPENPPQTLSRGLFPLAPDARQTAGELLKSLQNPLYAWYDPGCRVSSLRLPTVTASASAGYGHTLLRPDPDGEMRRDMLLVSFDRYAVPSFALRMAAAYSGLSLGDLKVIRNRSDFYGIQLGWMKIPTDRALRLPIGPVFTAEGPPLYSASELLDGRVPAGAFKNKAVLVGLTGSDTTRLEVPGIGEEPDVVVAARILDRLLSGSYVVIPPWGWIAEAAALLYFGFFLLFVLPRVSLKVGALILGIFLTTWYALVAGVFLQFGVWLAAFPPALFTLLGFSLLAATRWVAAIKSRNENITTSKMQGLTFQGQGMLDLAFEKFMKCPVEDPSVKELLYNLGLDFERKRLFHKAAAVYEHLAKAGKFKDIRSRLDKMRQTANPVVLGGSNRHDATMVLENVGVKPTLGRYEVLRELGQGAMGTVYLGRDPRINREVAIKTLSYGAIEPERLAEVKERFFREAEAAGRLNHPNIVTIYDVGEDHDMAYMAMELLQGKDLSQYCRKGHLLTPAKILQIVAGVAAALEYAHEHDVVHRDIKPANIMYMENGQIKVTDFGIARVISSSQTQTGVVLGTPSYMSPEQVAGKKVDGRSDLFSLGCVFYELLCGEKPFQGESIAALMYNIANGSYVKLEEIQPGAPGCCVDIVDKLLAKALSRRYASASQVLKQVQQCLQEIG